MKKRKVKPASTKPPRLPRDPVTGQQFIFDPDTGEPTRPYRRRKPTAEEIVAVRARRAASRQRYEASRAAFRARIGRRPVEMQQGGYTLPADVSAFLLRLHRAPPFYGDQTHVSVAEAREIAEEAYMAGCRQGFIEGFLYGEEKARPGALKNRERLREQNLKKLERLGIAERNAEIVAEFHRLERDMPGVEDRYQHLAGEAAARRPKPGRENWPTTSRQIGNIIREAMKPRR